MSAALAYLPSVWACQAIPSVTESEVEHQPEPMEAVEPALAFYRKYTEAMLRRYTRCSMEAGRIPSMLGREMFRGKVTAYRVHSFEDVVIFVHDVEKCMGRLEQPQQRLLTRIAIQEYTHEEMAGMLGLPRRTVVRRYQDAIDRLTAVFLEVKLLEPLKACQEGKNSKTL